jgi:hypothetical protein
MQEWHGSISLSRFMMLRLPRPHALSVAIFILPFAITRSAHGQQRDTTTYHHEAAPVIHAARLNGSIHIDGSLDDAAWSQAEPVSEFTQLDPEEGKPCSERTEVRVLIGDDALYVGARLFDHDASRIKARLARRDDAVESDAFTVSIDSYHDHLTARVFRVTPAGAIRDAAIGADGSEDDSWDAVWDAKARVDSSGWSAEFRIPLSQLRYNTQTDATWGVQFERTIFRRGETALFAFTPKKEQGGVSRFGHLVGLGRLPKQHRLELLPYSAMRNERLDFPADDPFRSGSDYFGNAGMDLKYGLTSDLTLDLTTNPDFGQVEVDPAEVNLTAIETFFPERRGFFVESADLFTFGRSRAHNNITVPTIFHSRRIGRPPQVIVRGKNFGFVDRPALTSIGGAAKVTGRTRSGWSVGVLDAVTTHEDANFLDTLGVQHQVQVEPLTHYFAGRVRRDFRQGNTSVGGLLTAVNRKLNSTSVESALRADAYVGGIDLAHAWKNRTWALDADVTGATVGGSPSAIAATQQTSVRYFQRPDHDGYATYDPTRTRLSGYGVDASVSKTAGEHWLGSYAYVSRSPGYEANDTGFQTRADYRGASGVVFYQQNHPNRWLRNYTLFPYWNQMWNFGGDLILNSYAFDLSGTFANFWPFGARWTLSRPVADDRLTRGGPQARAPNANTFLASLTSDTRRSWSVGVTQSHTYNDAGGYADSPSLTVSFRPSPTLRLRFEPSYSATHAISQFVLTSPDSAATATFGSRYVFATLDQRVLSLVTRVDWTLAPRLSFQLYLQPLVVTGAFSRFKEFRTPGAYDFDVFGIDRGSVARDPNGVYRIDPGNGRIIAFGDPSFNFRSLLGNAVLRWEYRPGSTIYLVWQQTRAEEEPFGDFDFSRDERALVDQHPQNVFAIKATYWIGL